MFILIFSIESKHVKEELVDTKIINFYVAWFISGNTAIYYLKLQTYQGES